MAKINTIRNLGEFIRKTRKEQGLTLEQLAAVSGVGIRFLSELENGKETCHIGKVLTVLSNLGLTMAVYGDGEE
ncbi:MAG: helix-turn-helix domain-containing protein [Methyloligellaceae bacterium]